MKIYKGICIGLCLLWGQTTSAVEPSVDQEQKYQQLLDQDIQIIQQSKLILDVESSTATAQQQQEALCQRLGAYQNIIALADVYQQVEQAQAMKRVAQVFLKQQNLSFEQSGMTIDAWCEKK